MIPSIIHQIWLNPPLPPQYSRWNQGLKEFHPGWEVRLWTRENLPDYDRVLERYDLKGYPPNIASDVFRVMVVLRYGGFYLDLDCEPVGTLEPLREHGFVCCGDVTMRTEYGGYPLRVNSGDGFGAETGSPILSSFMERCDLMRGSSENILYRYGFLGFSEHLWERRAHVTLIPRRELDEKYYRHHWHGGWYSKDALKRYRPIYAPSQLKEPFRKSPAVSGGANRPMSGEEYMRWLDDAKHRGLNLTAGCCDRPLNGELMRR